MEFAVTLTYQPTQGNALVENANFWFVCNGVVANLWARVPYFGTCPMSDLKIDNEQIFVPSQ